MLTDDLDNLVESAKLLGRAEARKETGCYTPDDSRFCAAMYEAISKYRRAIEAAVLQAQPTDQRLLNLLCRIHRDGGHYIAEHGLDKAVEDADIRVAEQNAALEAQGNAKLDRGDGVDALLHAVFQVCEATEEIESKNDFERGRVFEAKHIRNGIGNWFQDTFCGKAFMGEPVLEAQGKQEPVAWMHWFKYYDGTDVVRVAIGHCPKYNDQDPFRSEPLFAAPVVQPDMVTVPREPTDAMLDAAMNRYKHVSPEAKARYTKMHRENFRCDYRAMIAEAEKEQA